MNYRDSNRNEIDLVLLKGTSLYPIEIKKATIARQADASVFRHLQGVTGFDLDPGTVIYGGDQPLPLAGGAWAYPVSCI